MENKYLPRKYLVIFLDFLGQKEFFGNIADTTVPKEVMDKIAYLSDSIKFGYMGMRLLGDIIVKESGNVYKQLVERNIEPYSSSPKEWFEYEIARCKPKVQTFSDGTLVCFPLNDDVAPILMPNLMFYLCRHFLHCLFEGVMYRGCITFADGWEIGEGVLYGPVVDRAGFIEKNIARYPRVIVSDEVVDYFNANHISCYSPCIDKLICVDSDGSYILDYLSLEFLNSPILGKDRDVVWKYVRYMHWFVRKELARFRDAQNSKMYWRYRLWDAYSYHHEEALRSAGVLGDSEMSCGSSHERSGTYKLGKYLLFYLQFQPEPLQKLGYDGMMGNAAIISQVAAEINGLHQRLKANARDMFREQFGEEMTDEEIDAEVAMIESASCGTIQMSNYLMFYVRNNGHCGGNYFLCWLAQMKILLRNCALHGVFARGSINYGIGWEIEKGYLYGPVIQTAAKLEETRAVYPRIVIADSILRELGIGGEDDASKEEGATDYIGNEYIRRDEDFVWIFDYLEIDEEDMRDQEGKKVVDEIRKGHDETHRLCQEILNTSRKGFVSNPDKIWPALQLNMYFRRKLAEANERKGLYKDT